MRATNAIFHKGFNGLATVRHASGFGSGDTNAAPQSLTGHAANVGDQQKKIPD